jgi:20S proteasome subunit alpha 1
MEKTMKVFSPDGRIYQMEYAFKAIQQAGMTSIAIRGKDSVVVCCSKKVPDKLIVPDSVTNIFSISEDCGAIIVGNMNDARFIVNWLRQQAAEHKFKFAYEAPIHMISKRLGQYLQKYSQYAGIRPFCVSVTLVGCDEEFGPQCFRIDPSGQQVGFRAVSSGTKEQEAMSQLEKQFKKNNGDWDNRQTVETALTVLQAVTSSDFKADEVEIGYCNVENPRFRKLAENEIENVLNDLADKQ